MELSAFLNNYTMQELATHIILLLAQLCYFGCLIPQIITNYRQKSGAGVSSFLLIGYLNAYLFLIFYVFCMDLPLPYKVMVPLQTIATCILVAQRLYYDPNPGIKKFWGLYGLNILIFLPAVPYALCSPLELGHVFGWCSFVLAVVNQLPQVVKIHQEKSVAGFNFLFVLFTTAGALLEIAASCITYLPLQTKLMAWRAIILFFIFSWQFYRYQD